ncbi:hypothetical protein HGRIS_004309 [Hohenbuehelia grisea]|uniref:Uncharacterized protein n=1 Tax=Hohenbuehelia grisea TaxID=104357 RepID=A0ABR3IPD3_9AGAR
MRNTAQKLNQQVLREEQDFQDLCQRASTELNIEVDIDGGGVSFYPSPGTHHNPATEPSIFGPPLPASMPSSSDELVIFGHADDIPRPTTILSNQIMSRDTTRQAQSYFAMDFDPAFGVGEAPMCDT